jgi:GDP/UDP-N,N'-diacetylbacillosamine 2-epimerase (hydrolysing)
MKIGILTSSRADYSQYLPLLKLLQKEAGFELKILVFGTHLSQKFGNTYQDIIKDGFSIAYKIETETEGDGPEKINNSISKTIIGFTKVWSQEKFDLVFALGDRYEMFAACTSTLPFNIKLAHIHGGEKTEGAIDDAYRHSITHMSYFHFTSTEKYKQRVEVLKESNLNVYNVGALSIDNLTNLKLFSKEEFAERFNIDINKPSVLITFHPETKSYLKNETYILELIAALSELKDYQLIITMPNADTMGNLIRENLNTFIKDNNNAIGVESFGTIGYLTCMKHCNFMLGNTSSGFLEASFFPKKVINLGSRQNGRIVTPNIINCDITRESILKAIKDIEILSLGKNISIYGKGDTAIKIVEILKSIKC